MTFQPDVAANALPAPLYPSRYGMPIPQLITLPRPPVGQQFLWQAPFDCIVRLSLIHGIFNTSVTVATRVVKFIITDQQTHDLWKPQFNKTVTASSQAQLFAAISAGGLGPALLDTFVNLPDVYFPPGIKVFSTVSAMQTTDTWSAVRILAQFF